MKKTSLPWSSALLSRCSVLIMLVAFANFAKCEELQSSPETISESSRADCVLPVKCWKEIEKLDVKGEILDRDNIQFTLSFAVDFIGPDILPLVRGDVTELNSELKPDSSGFFWSSGGKFKLVVINGTYSLLCLSPGKCSVSFTFASRVSKKDNWSATAFAMPSALSRSFEILSPRKDIELDVFGALNVQTLDEKVGGVGTKISGILPPDGDFSAKWRWNVEKIDAELIVSADSGFVTVVSPGAVRLDGVVNYSVIQGKMRQLEFAVSPGLNILNVIGENVQDWKVEKKENSAEQLSVSLSRDYEKDYSLVIRAEMILPDFPCKFSLPSVVPLNVLRYGGHLAFGTNGAIKLVVESTRGLAQIDGGMFPAISAGRRGETLRIPQKSLFAYKFSGGDFALSGSADNIIPSFSADMNYVASFKDEDMYLRAMIELEIKDAPLKELMIRYGNAMTVTRVEGRRVAAGDYELIEKDGEKWLKIPFVPDTVGKTELFVNMESGIKDMKDFEIPALHIESARNVRGFLLLAASRGLLVSVLDSDNLRSAPVGSSPIREAGLQHLFRIRGQNWKCRVELQREKPKIISELFNICSIGEGTLYGSAAFTYHVSGAPLDKLVFFANSAYRNIEFTGSGIVDWKKLSEENGVQELQVNFKDKVFGDFNLLATYEVLLGGKDAISRIADIATKDAEFESGFATVCSVRNLAVKTEALSGGVSEIENSELPPEYKAMTRIPVLKSFKFNVAPHWIDLRISPYDRQKLLDMAVDLADIRTIIDRNGEAVTTARYRIKNSSRQFISVELPEKAVLWSVKVDGETRRVSNYGESGREMLVPVPRKLDTDSPIAVEIVYAEKFGELGASKSISLRGPSAKVEKLLTSWGVELPAGYELCSYSGNMDALSVPEIAGVSGMLKKISAWIPKMFLHGIFLPWCGAVLAGGLLAWRLGSKKAGLITWSLSLSLIFLMAIFAAFILYSFVKALPKPASFSALEFSRLFTLPEDSVSLDMSIVNMKLLPAKKLFAIFAGFLSALVLGVLSFKTRGNFARAFLLAAGISAFLVSGSGWLAFNALASLAVSIFFYIATGWAVCVALFRFSRRRSAALAVSAILAFASCANADAWPYGLTLGEAKYAIVAGEKGINGELELSILAEKPTTFPLLEAPAVLTRGVENNTDMEIFRKDSKYLLRIKRAGDYSVKLGFLLPFKDDGAGRRSFSMKILPSMKNMVRISSESKSVDIEASECVSSKKEIVDGITTLTASFVPGARISFLLQPQGRNVEKETVQFFANLDVLANFSSGFVELWNRFEMQIAQGETSKFVIAVPPNNRVTSVECADLGAWRYAPEKNLLEIYLSRPVHGVFKIAVASQIANCNLPFDVKIQLMKVLDAGRQHGTIGLACEQSVQIQVESASGLNNINVADFNSDKLSREQFAAIKKAFRYQNPEDAFAVIKAEAVEPEIRVEENTRLAFEEERTTIVSSLSLEVGKSGIFSLSIETPPGFDLDKIYGDAIQHWDEIGSPENKKIVVHFERRMLGNFKINLEMSSSEHHRNGIVRVPKISVMDSNRLRGELNIAVEQGVRMDIVSRKGLEARTESFKTSLNDSASQRFSIVRKDWALDLQFEKIEPWIQVETLQVAKIGEGVIESEAYFNYAIENAGVKTLRVKLPPSSETPEFDCESISSCQKLDGGVWEIELMRKVMRKFNLRIRFRQNFGAAEALIEPIVALGAELQKGYLAILSDDTLQTCLVSKHGEITDFDARKIPSTFKLEYLKNAVICFRTVGADYSLSLAVKRHSAADMLKAEIRNVHLTSSVSKEGRIVTTAVVNLNNGNENYMRIKLPPQARVWSVSIDSQAVDAAREEDSILVPLLQSFSGTGREQNLSITYSLDKDKNWSSGDQIYLGPSFGLPLKNVSWELFLPADSNYKDFSGTLDWVNTSTLSNLCADIQYYDAQSSARMSRNNESAKSNLTIANKLAKSGKYDEALEAFQNAANFSQNDIELNSDIQGQMLELQRNQSMSAFFNRRNVQRKSKMISHGETAIQPVQQQRESQTDGYSQTQPVNIDQIRQQLGGEEVKSLQQISDRIFLQQQAAAETPHPLHPEIPTAGVRLLFNRPLLVTPFAPVKVSFRARKSFDWNMLSPALSISAIFAFVFACALLSCRRTE